jgi:hypothetical protein
MRTQTKPFTVEVKSRRKQSDGPNWGALIDDLPPEELPTREVQADRHADQGPLGAANRTFSAFASNAISTVTTLGDLAATVFGSKPPKAADATSDEKCEVQPTRGRILPSLVPLNPFEAGTTEDLRPVRRRRKTARATDAQPIPEDQVPQDERATETEPAAEVVIPPGGPSSARPQRRNGKSRRGETRVRAGEGWKRRRLPKVCW